jgi:hypothetical protein
MTPIAAAVSWSLDATPLPRLPSADRQRVALP